MTAPEERVCPTCDGAPEEPRMVDTGEADFKLEPIFISCPNPFHSDQPVSGGEPETCPRCGCKRELRGELYDVGGPPPRRCDDSFHNPVPPEPAREERGGVKRVKISEPFLQELDRKWSAPVEVAIQRVDEDGDLELIFRTTDSSERTRRIEAEGERDEARRYLNAELAIVTEQRDEAEKRQDAAEGESKRLREISATARRALAEIVGDPREDIPTDELAKDAVSVFHHEVETAQRNAREAAEGEIERFLRVWDEFDGPPLTPQDTFNAVAEAVEGLRAALSSPPTEQETRDG